MTFIIGLSGKKRSGKNSVYFMLKLLLDEDETGMLRKVSMADKLKEIARYVGWNGLKDDKGRRLLQLLGTEVLRGCIDDAYHVKYVEKAVREVNSMPKCVHTLQDAKIVVIPDIRFPNEVEMVHRLGGEVWRVRRPNFEAAASKDQHKSEKALDNFTDWNAVLVANNFEELLQEVKKQVERLQKDGRL